MEDFSEKNYGEILKSILPESAEVKFRGVFRGIPGRILWENFKFMSSKELLEKNVKGTFGDGFWEIILSEMLGVVFVRLFVGWTFGEFS